MKTLFIMAFGAALTLAILYGLWTNGWLDDLLAREPAPKPTNKRVSKKTVEHASKAAEKAGAALEHVAEMVTAMIEDTEDEDLDKDEPSPAAQPPVQPLPDPPALADDTDLFVNEHATSPPPAAEAVVLAEVVEDATTGPVDVSNYTKLNRGILRVTRALERFNDKLTKQINDGGGARAPRKD